MAKYDVAIIGAGPYGLSVAAHLRAVKGLDVCIFGEPMSFWQNNMPVGMLLRSNWTATQIADPDQALTLEAYQAATGSHFSRPVPLECFVQYGLWYQRQALLRCDQRKVSRVENNPQGFRVTLQDGETIFSRRIVIAAGIASFAWRPPEFAKAPHELVSHASEHRNLQQFSGKRVLVIGSGQSALESAALMHEYGVEVEVVGRARQICWLQGWASTTLHSRLGKAVKNFLYAPTDVGPAVISQLVARPDLLKSLPRSVQDRLRKRAVRPAGARWLVDRLRNVPITLGRSVASVAYNGDRATVRFDDGSERTADHVLVGTGYKVDISKYDFLAPELLQSVARANGYPRLGPGLQTSVTGLHIVGSPAAWSFGPLMQFVSGAGYASRSIVRSICGKSDVASRN